MEKELELTRAKGELVTGNETNRSVDLGNTTSIESLIKSVKALTIDVPSKPEAWNLFFSSIERAFVIKNVPEDIKAEILINLLGEKVNNILVYVSEEDLKNYDQIKSL